MTEEQRQEIIRRLDRLIALNNEMVQRMSALTIAQARVLLAIGKTP